MVNDTQAQPPEAQARPCAAHPATETRLSCTECGQAICPQCMVPYEAGFKCPACAGKRTSHVFQASAAQQALVSVLALAAGFAYGFMHPRLLSLGFFTFFGIPVLALVLAYFAGRLAGAVIHRLIGYKLGGRILGLLSGFALLGLLVGPFGGVALSALGYVLNLQATGFSLVETVFTLMQLIAPVLFIKGMRRAFGG